MWVLEIELRTSDLAASSSAEPSSSPPCALFFHQLLPQTGELGPGGGHPSECWSFLPMFLPHNNRYYPSPLAGFIKSPLSQDRWVGGSVVLHCEAMGSPVPEIQWWFEGHGPNDTCTQLWDGARLDRVRIHATYRQHAASLLSVNGLVEDTGTYECRASNNPDCNHLTQPPRVKWVRTQASVVVLEREWPGHLPPLPSCAIRP